LPPTKATSEGGSGAVDSTPKVASGDHRVAGEGVSPAHSPGHPCWNLSCNGAWRPSKPGSCSNPHRISSPRSHLDLHMTPLRGRPPTGPCPGSSGAATRRPRIGQSVHSLTLSEPARRLPHSFWLRRRTRLRRTPRGRTIDPHRSVETVGRGGRDGALALVSLSLVSLLRHDPGRAGTPAADRADRASSQDGALGARPPGW